MENIRNISEVFNNNHQGCRLKRRPKIDGINVYKRIITTAKLIIGKKGRKEQS
jgi:hypothetical protein